MSDAYKYGYAFCCSFNIFTSAMTANMGNDVSEKQTQETSHVTIEKAGYDKSGAIDAENIEHDMTVMQAVKAYPAASLWAFVMSSTIVSSHLSASKAALTCGSDYGVILRLFDGTIHSHGAVPERLWSQKRHYG